LWGQYFGKIASVRKGVAGRIRRYGETALALAPEYSDAGPYRLLGRLHALAPIVPFFTSWIDRDRAIEMLTKAVEVAPDDPLNRLFLGEALLEYRRSEKQRALELIRTAAHAKPRPGRELEDTEAIRDAQDRLAQLEG
jgi:tetratricopeptide (TPR) repeat protein